MQTDEKTLIVAADGVHARLFEELRQGGRLAERADLLDGLAATHKSASARATVHDRMGFAQHATDGHDPHRQSEEDFLRRLAERIGVVMRDERFEALILFAPPRALGVLREHLDPQARARLAHDADADRVDETPDALREHVQALRFPVSAERR